MKRFGFVVFPEKGNSMRIKALAVDGGECTFPSTEEDQATGRGYPQAAFYDYVEYRDSEMEAYAKKFPGVMFCPVTVETGVKYAVQTKPTKFAISEKGLLPQ